MEVNPSSDEQTWIVTVTPGGSLESVGRELQRAGLVVEQVLDQVEIVTARGTEGSAVKARQIPGVVDVSPDLHYDVGHPDSEVS